jgi:glyoxylase-like metal-dependent hydrolase (beta-lactamase superfamily II)
MDDLIVKKLELGPIGTNAFLLWENKGSEAILIDAPPDCGNEISKILKENDLTLSEIWLTHGHWDHMAGVKEVSVTGY